MTKISIDDVMSYKVVADKMVKRCRKFRYHVYGVTMDAIDISYSHLDEHKWWRRADDVIRDYFTFDDDVDEGLIVGVILEHREILVIADFNGKRYFAQPIKPKNGKNQIKDILDNMGVVKDVIDVYTNNMEENNMVDMELAIERLADDIAERANGTMGDYFTDVTENMWDFSRDDIDEDRLREILLENVDGLVDVEFTEPDDDRDIVRIWFDRPIKKKKQDSAKVAKVIKEYVDNYEGLLMDYNGYSVSICVPWDIFNEDDMKMLIEDEEFEFYVSQYLMKTDIYDMLVYDDGVYVSVDADMFDKVA